jgi:heterodisulfide reductase subunit A-like polyferredoxin
MFGNRKTKNQKQCENKFMKDTEGKCIYSQCGYSASHQRGVPCFAIICPTYKIPLTRQDNSGNKFLKKVENSNLKEVSFPIINVELYGGCSAFMNACLYGAIIIENKKAKINKEYFTKCLPCIDTYPVKAIMIN